MEPEQIADEIDRRFGPFSWNYAGAENRNQGLEERILDGFPSEDPVAIRRAIAVVCDRAIVRAMEQSEEKREWDAAPVVRRSLADRRKRGYTGP